jgi:bifunctional non-homologous end joining protein LigD
VADSGSAKPVCKTDPRCRSSADDMAITSRAASCRKNVLNEKFGYIAEALEKLPDNTVLDGELVALDDENRSNFNLLQNFKSAELRIHYYAFDVLTHKGKSLLDRPLAERREVLAKILPRNEHISLSLVGHSAKEMLTFVKKHGLGPVNTNGFK